MWQMMSNGIGVYFLIACSLIFFVMTFFVYRQLSLNTKNVNLCHKLLAGLNKQHDDLEVKYQIVKQVIDDIGSHQEYLQQEFSQLVYKVEQINVQYDPKLRLYTQAMKMVELGSNLDELIYECQLPRAEAELLIRLHSKTEKL